MPLRAHARTLAIAQFLRAMAPAVHKRRGGWMPRQQQPDAIRLAYFNAIMDEVRRQLAYAHSVRTEIMQLLMAERASALDRADTIYGRSRYAEELVKKAAVHAANAFRPRELEAVAEKFGHRTGEFNREQLGRQVKQALGVPLSAVEKPVRDLVPVFAKANVELVKTVSERYFDRMAKDVREAFETGMHPETLADRMVELDDIAENDARRIARDQIGKLNAQFNQERQEGLGVTSYIWRTARDSRVRDEHAEREGQSFDWSDPPEDGAPGEAIQCRCFAEPDLSPVVEDL